MAEGTHWKVTDDKLARHDELLADLLNSQQDMRTTQEEVRNTQRGIQGTLERAPAGQNNGPGLLPILAQDNRNHRAQQVPVLPPKWELPTFEGHEPKVWIRKCERYFTQYRTHDDQRVEAVALYLNGLAEVWYHSLVLSMEIVSWIEFMEELISRFGEIEVEDVVEEFNKLRQTGTVDEFLGKFEDLKAQMLIRNPALNEAHFLSSFVGALKEEIRFAVKMFKPTSLKVAIEKARMQEMAIEAAQRRNKGSTRSFPSVAPVVANKAPVVPTTSC